MRNPQSPTGSRSLMASRSGSGTGGARERLAAVLDLEHTTLPLPIGPDSEIAAYLSCLPTVCVLHLARHV